MSSVLCNIVWESRSHITSVILLLFCGVAASFGEGSYISIRDVVSVSGPDICLEDIVQSPMSLPDGWGARRVFKSPTPGNTEDYALTSIAYALQKYPDMKDVTLSGRMKLSVSREAVQISHEMIQQAVSRFAEEEPEWLNTRYELEFMPFLDRIMVAQGDLDIHVENWSENEQTGYIDFDVAIWVNGIPERMVSVPVNMIQMQEVWVAREDMKRGHVLSLDDLDVKYFPMGGRNKNYTPVSSSVTGQELIRNVKAGKPIIKYLVRPPVCANRNEAVNVHMVRGGLSVTLRAKALGKGRVGDRILCLNEQSQRRVLVRLVSDHEGIIEN